MIGMTVININDDKDHPKVLRKNDDDANVEK
jgi:hypothetical protein